MGLTLKINFQKPGTMLKKSVNIPINFMNNPEIVDLINAGYYYEGYQVGKFP